MSQRVRHSPQRTCIGCRQVREKRQLVRLVCTADGAVEVDTTGRMAGRGVYLCQSRSCWEAGLKKKRLDYAFRTNITAEALERLSKYVSSLPMIQGEQTS
ncbi:MAG: YlxR family protein [Chloroflexota bacterium]